jgi:hypothetical protein
MEAEISWFQDFNFWIGAIGVLATLLLGLLVWISTKAYNKNQTELAHDKLEKDLFAEFNSRYDALNEYLEKITAFGSLQGLEANINTHVDQGNSILRYKLNDYFNLCAEEYYWYCKKRISERIWISWHAGMNSWYQNHPIIREAWIQELGKYGAKSFYLDNGDEFFDNSQTFESTYYVIDEKITKKKEAIGIVNKALGKNELLKSNTCFSNLNKAKPIWWFDIPIKKFKEDLHLILAKENGFVWIKIPKEANIDVRNIFRIREDNGMVELKISSEPGVYYLRDITSGGKGLNFEQYIKKEFE